MPELRGPILVTGARGMLGSDLVANLRQESPATALIPLAHQELDITVEEAVREKVSTLRPAVIINCAATTDVDGCESQCELAFQVNATGPEVLARVAAEHQALLLHISTDFVFDGEKRTPYTEEDPPNPLSTYGRTKLAGEQAVRSLAPEHLILRTAWLYGRHGPNFVETILELADRQEELRVVTDQTGSPTWTTELSGAIVAILRAGARGTYHAVGSGSCSRFEWAREILRLAGKRARLSPATSVEFPRPAKRPAYSVLSSEKLARDAGFRLRPWDEALADYLSSREIG